MMKIAGDREREREREGAEGKLAMMSALLLALASCSAPETTLEWRAVPECGASLAPGARVEEPHAVALPGGEIAVAWGAVRDDGTADILFARASEHGIGSPARVNPVEGSAVAGRQVGPRLAVPAGDRGRGRLFISWVDRGRDPSGDILLASSEDGGLSFGPPVRVNADTGLAGQEYHDIAVLPGGDGVAIVWLDERDAPESKPNQKQLYAAVSRDGGRSFGANLELTESSEGVCPCCRPGLSASARGSLHVVYRDRVGGDLVIRTRHLDPGSEGFSEPVTVSRVPWRTDGCPVDGPSVLAGSGDEVHVAWMDASEGAEALWYAVSGDGGQSFRPARPLVRPAAVAPAAGAAGHETSCCHDSGEAQPGRAVLARRGAEGAPVVAWEDSSGSVWVAGSGDGGAMAIRVAGSDRASARSATLAADDRGRIHVFFVEHRVEDLAPEGPRGRLGHVLLMDLGDRLRLRE